jgi:DNA-binding CsgD family transcriptional regulator
MKFNNVTASRISDEISEKFSKVSSLQDVSDFLASGLGDYGFADVTYYTPKSTVNGGGAGRLITTYSRDWQDHYFNMSYQNKDPIIRVGQQSYCPIDWSALKDRCDETKKMFGEAREFGLSDRGVVIPMRGHLGEITLISVTSNLGDAEWVKYLSAYKSEMVNFAFCLHGSILSLSANTGEEQARLTAREKQVLQWAAFGKTSWETAMILGLSERTIETYVAKAMAKLEASTKAHAVCKSLSLGVISADTS